MRITNWFLKQLNFWKHIFYQKFGENFLIDKLLCFFSIYFAYIRVDDINICEFIKKFNTNILKGAAFYLLGEHKMPAITTFELVLIKSK